jgi:hypothetical protein
MNKECRGIVIRQTKILKGQRMLLLITDQYGKISCGTSISERGKSRSALATRRFSLGQYQISELRGYRSVRSADLIKSYYNLSENYDKYIAASMVLELTEKILPEDLPSPEIYKLLITYMDMIEARKRSFDTLTIAYIIKVLQTSGLIPLPESFGEHELLKTIDSDTISAITYIMDCPLDSMLNLEFNPEKGAKLLRLVLRYSSMQFDIGPLKSDIPKEV